MKILFLLFLLILLLLHGATGERRRGEMGEILNLHVRRGYCSFGECPPDAWSIGSCSEGSLCCRGPWH
uniref:Beta-defensin-like domain-containing protein n=1 Tax=Malurus cyaneus samueli TaxID=2593467 RepID=A0A8C5TDJ4_9PASS